MGRAAITDHAIEVPIFQPLAERGAHVSGIKTDRLRCEVESFPLAIKSLKLGATVMDVGGGDMGIDDQGVCAAVKPLKRITLAF